MNFSADRLFRWTGHNREVLYLSLGAYLILLLAAFALPVEFSGYKTSDKLAPIWYFITESGGVYGSMMIASVFFLLLILHFRRRSKTRRHLYIFIALVIAADVLTIGFTQLYAKGEIKEPRPSQVYLIEKGVIENGGREFLSMPMQEKQKYLQQRSEQKRSELKDVYPPVLSLWTNDLTYSFPSGHSQSSFFLGVLISYALYCTLKRGNRYLAGLPLAWAVLVSLSRIVIGVHYPVDVAAGAFIGMASALFVTALKFTHRVFNDNRTN